MAVVSDLTRTESARVSIHFHTYSFTSESEKCPFLDGDPAALPVTEVRFSREPARLKNGRVRLVPRFLTLHSHLFVIQVMRISDILRYPFSFACLSSQIL